MLHREVRRFRGITDSSDEGHGARALVPGAEPGRGGDDESRRPAPLRPARGAPSGRDRKTAAWRGDVLVQVVAASVHPGDYFVMTGEPYVVRLVFGLRRPRHGIPGRDLAGVVAAVGKDVTDLQPGDEVFGWSTAGTLAEYACVPADNLAPVPANLSVVDSGSGAHVGHDGVAGTARHRDVRPGQTVLVTGASGGVGTFAVQIAKAFGAEVTGVCSTRNVDLVRSLGADHVVDYTRTDFTRTEKRYDVILDNVEAQPLAAVRRALTPTGTLIPNSGRGGRWLGPLGRIVKARVLSGFTRQQLKPSRRSGSARTCSPWPTSSRPGRSRRSSTAPTPSTKQPTPSATSGPATPEGRSSSPSDDRTDENAQPVRMHARPAATPAGRTAPPKEEARR